MTKTEWNINQICLNIYGHFDHNKGEVVRRALRTMRLPGTWRWGWRGKGFSLYDPCSDARLADLQKRIEHLQKKGWRENAKACAEELIRLRALKALSPKCPDIACGAKYLRHVTVRRFSV
jgi:hypothetical protein